MGTQVPVVAFKAAPVLRNRTDEVPSRFTNNINGSCVHRCALNTCVQYLSGLPGLADALLNTTCSDDSVTTAIGVAVKRSPAQGPGMVGDLSQLINVLTMHPATKQLIQEGSRGRMADVDVREVASTLLAAIQTEMVQDLQLMQDALQVELDEDKLYLPTMVTRLKQLDGKCVHCSHCTTSFDGCPTPCEIVSVDRSQGRHQSLQDIFSASMKQTAHCCEQNCMALHGQAVQEQFVRWPLALMLFFQQMPGKEVKIDLHEYVRLGACPDYYRLVRLLFYQHNPPHFTAAACRADGLWVYLDSSEPVQTSPLGQLQQKHGHEVVAALLITTQQPDDDNNHVLAADLLREKLQPASDQHRSAGAVRPLSMRPAVRTAPLPVPATPRSVLTPAYAASSLGSSMASSMASLMASSLGSSQPTSPLIAARRHTPAIFSDTPRLGSMSRSTAAARQLAVGFQLGDMTSKREQALQLNQLHERSLDKLQKQQRMLQQAKQDEAAERCRAGMAAAAKEAAAKEVAAKEAAREAAANANKGSQPAVVQPLSSTAQTPAVAVDLAGVAEKGQQDIDVQVCQPVSKAEKARLQREMAHRRKAKAKEVKAAARAAEDAAEHAANEYIAEQAAATEAAEVDQHDDSQQVEEAAVVEDDAVEDVVDPKVDVDPQQVNDAESVEDKVSEEVVVEDAPHTPSVAQSEGPAAGLLAGDAPMPHAVNTRVADDSQQKEDAEALEDVVHEGIVVDGPHSPSVASSEGLSGLHHVADDEAVPYAVMAAGSVFVAGTLVMGAWCAAFTSPVWVPRVGIRCMRAAWSSWALKKNSN